MPEKGVDEQTDSLDILDVASIPGDITCLPDDSDAAQPDSDTANIYQNQLADDKHRKNVEELEGLKQDRQQRKEFAVKIYWLIVCWLGGVAILLFLVGWGGCGFRLSDAVLVALISGTSANVIGLLAIVILYLFPRRKG